jgi:hypothetical protein
MFNTFYILVSAILLAVVLVLIGHYDVKYGIAEKEQSICNKYNPELQRLLNK